MSFSSTVKNEIARIIPGDDCCKKAELSGLIRVGGAIMIGSNMQLRLEIRTENAAVARKFLTLSKSAYDIETEISVLRKNRLKKNNTYRIVIADEANVKKILVDLGISDDGFFLNQGVSARIFESVCCRRAFIRGLFLGAGSVTDPDFGYHLEIILEDSSFAETIVELLRTFDLSPKISLRKNHYIVYIKESEQIVDFLNIIEAHNALFAYENTRIQKGMRNQVNRLVNCETANMNKSIDAAFRQLQYIETIDRYMGIENLPEGLQDLARLRIENPDTSLKELGEMLNPPVGKSGVNHRMRKIETIAKSFRRK